MYTEDIKAVLHQRIEQAVQRVRVVSIFNARQAPDKLDTLKGK